MKFFLFKVLDLSTRCGNDLVVDKGTIQDGVCVVEEEACDLKANVVGAK